MSPFSQSGYESIAFTSDGGFIAGGWGNHEGGWPSFKSGGQVEFGVPIYQKFSAAVALQATAFGSPPTPEWTFKCDSTNCDATVKVCFFHKTGLEIVNLIAEISQKLSCLLSLPLNRKLVSIHLVKKGTKLMKTEDGSFYFVL